MTGDLSTAGTTATTVVIRKSHLFVANVGDSSAVMGLRNPLSGKPGQPPIIAWLISCDHKPQDVVEQRRIQELG